MKSVWFTGACEKHSLTDTREKLFVLLDFVFDREFSRELQVIEILTTESLAVSLKKLHCFCRQLTRRRPNSASCTPTMQQPVGLASSHSGNTLLTADNRWSQLILTTGSTDEFNQPPHLEQVSVGYSLTPEVLTFILSAEIQIIFVHIIN